MPANFPLTIVTPEGRIFDEQVESLKAPGTDGYFGIMANHQPMIAAISRGILTVRGDAETAWFGVVGGVVQVDGEGTMVLADYAKEADSSDEAAELAKAAMRDQDA